MTHVPWHVKGVRPEVREVARDAARRSGLSVGAWLNSLIVDAAAHQDATADAYRRFAPFGPAGGRQPPRIDETALAAIRQDVDELKRQMSRTQVEPVVHAQQLHDIEARINALQGSRCDDVEDALRRHFAAFRQTLKEAPSIEELANLWRQDLVEISAMLRDAMPTSVIAALEGQVQALGDRLEAHRGAEATTGAMADIEQALAGIRDRLAALTPAEQLTELSHAVKLLAHKADSIATANTAPEKMQQLEHAIEALQGLASQVASRDVIASLSHDIKALGDKIDRNSRPAVDSGFMQTLERRLAEIAEAVGRCRPLEDAPVPTNFDAVIKALADRLEAIQVPPADQGALKSLEQRIDTLVDKLDHSGTRPDRRDEADRGMEELLAQIKELRAQNDSRLAALQEQFATSAADAISGPAESIRRDVASLKEIQSSVDRRTQDTFEAVYGTIEQMVDRLAAIEGGLRDGQYPPHADPLVANPETGIQPAAAQARFPAAAIAEAPTLVPSATPMPDRTATAYPAEPDGMPAWATTPPPDILSDHPSAAGALLRHPAVPGFAPDAPIEPGSGARRVRVVANAIDRIAASEAAAGTAKPAESAAPLRADFVAAARRAAQAVTNEHEETLSGRFERSAQQGRKNFRTGTLSGMARPRIKSVVLGVSAVILVLGALRLALDFFHDPGVPESVPPVTRMEDAVQPGDEAPPAAPELPLDQPTTQKGANLEAPALPAPPHVNAVPEETVFGHIAPRQAPRWNVLPDMAATAAIPHPTAVRTPIAVPTAPAAGVDLVASSSVRNAALQGPFGRDPGWRPAAAAAPDLAELPLPATIGGKALIAAAAAGDPGASYEVATRFAQGRNAPQDLAMAAAWFERAARSGLAPAQFRLGSMYEKGLGIKKDLAEARRLYVAAADKGHAKAMHNLAVLYAEGLDGKPDYAVASQWFRRAAMHGIVDSQYNLAILYARGVGVERNLAESYKWFALAAKGGDKDAARKRDEIAVRLDAKQLDSAKLNAESFVAEPQPDEANATRVPAGGWDQVATAATTKSRIAH